ncbi:MAG TPA: energy-coupling factor transporter transmembrane component T [Planctomycetota bacterium]|nr:energy-coupling factor transporter transmembrane component T [Planctomycetota bacterium]
MENSCERKAGQAGNILDPRAKLAMVLCLYTAACAAGDAWRLALVWAAAATWALCTVHSHLGRSAGTLMAIAVGAGALAGMRFGQQWTAAVAETAVRVCIVLVGGRAFSRSTGTGELAAALQRLRCPRSVVLVLLACQGMVDGLGREVDGAREAARARAACLGTPRSPAAAATTAWWAMVSFCARLLRRADTMAAAAELRGFSRPGNRTSLHSLRFGVLDGCVVAACCVAAALLSWK